MGHVIFVFMFSPGPAPVLYTQWVLLKSLWEWMDMVGGVAEHVSGSCSPWSCVCLIDINSILTLIESEAEYLEEVDPGEVKIICPS